MQYGLVKSFSRGMDDEDMIKLLPMKAEELLRELFTACRKEDLTPDLSSLMIYYRHTDPHDGPMGMESETGTLFRAILGAKVKVN